MAEEKKFQPMKAGEAPSMLDAEVANEVIDLCAAVDSMTIIPQGRGTWKRSGRTAVLDLSGTGGGSGGDDGERMIFRVNIGGAATDVSVHAELDA